MKLVTLLTAGLTLGLLAAAPAAAQDRHDRGRHEGWRDHDNRGHHYGWRNHHHCRWVWRHHHRVRVCF